MTTVNDLKLNEYVQGDNGEVLKIVALIDHPESDSLRRVGFKDMAYTQKDVFTTHDLPRVQTVIPINYVPRKVGRPANV